MGRSPLGLRELKRHVLAIGTTLGGRSPLGLRELKLQWGWVEKQARKVAARLGCVN